ncbi:MAG: hypothetical protein HWD90_03805 [Campylobacteraceae bacterium]|nr:hypothetical protein [Campylobacteraceae bacterium]
MNNKYTYKGNNYYVLEDKVKIQIDDVWVEGVLYTTDDCEYKFVRSKEEFYSKFKKVNDK